MKKATTITSSFKTQDTFNSEASGLFVDRIPTYPKIRRDHIAIHTLEYFGLPWEYDRVSFGFSLSRRIQGPVLTADLVGCMLYHCLTRDDEG